MAERLTPTSPLSPLADAAPGIAIGPVDGLQAASLAAFAGRAAELSAAVHHIWGAVLPTTPRRVARGDIAFLWAGPDRWLVTASVGPDLEHLLRRHLGELAAVTDQSDGRIMLRISGSGVREMLAKLIGIDLHARSFRAGDTALTLAGHVPVHIWQIDDTPVYEVAVSRSLAESFSRELQAAAAT